MCTIGDTLLLGTSLAIALRQQSHSCSFHFPQCMDDEHVTAEKSYLTLDAFLPKVVCMTFFPLGRLQIDGFHQMRSNTCAQGAGVVERPPEDFQRAIFYIFSPGCLFSGF